MFCPKPIFDKLTQTYEMAMSQTRQSVDVSIDRILAAKDNELKAIIQAKDEQISFLKSEVERLVSLFDHERCRAEAAVDGLLNKIAETNSIRNADIEREMAKQNADPFGPEKSSTLSKIFSEVNTVGEDYGEENKDERLTKIGGMAVG